jgi:pentatricopeptide repeat protein
MEGVNEECDCEPDIFSYSLLLDALAESGQKGAGERAEQILDALENQYGEVCRVAYNTVLKVWKNSDSPEAASRAEKILKRMADLHIADRISYTSYIATLANKGDPASAQRAHDIANQMLKSYKEGNLDTKPNSQTWNTVIYAWVKCGDLNRAAETLRLMEGFQADGEVDMAPTVVSYSTVMDGLAKSKDGDAVKKTEEIFNRMWAYGNDNARPELWTYVTLIQLYAKQRDARTAQKAEDLIFAMFKEYQNGNTDMKPNAQLITAVMEAWAKSGTSKAAKKAEALLNWMISVSEEENDSELAPNEYSFSSKYEMLRFVSIENLPQSIFSSYIFQRQYPHGGRVAV